jgi:diadenosine tetraphosphate (Ap4A) HIT family hydrolase
MSASDFALDPQLAADAVALVEWPLSGVLLMNDRRFPWLILVPRRAGATEAFDLPQRDRARLWLEVGEVARRLKGETGVLKINIGALGNIVRQLHVHVVGRTVDDIAWPRPVWGFGTREPYDADALSAACMRFRALLSSPPD